MIKRRLLSGICVFAMLLGMVPGFGVARAEPSVELGEVRTERQDPHIDLEREKVVLVADGAAQSVRFLAKNLPDGFEYVIEAECADEKIHVEISESWEPGSITVSAETGAQTSSVIDFTVYRVEETEPEEPDDPEEPVEPPVEIKLPVASATLTVIVAEAAQTAITVTPSHATVALQRLGESMTDTVDITVNDDTYAQAVRIGVEPANVLPAGLTASALEGESGYTVSVAADADTPAGSYVFTVSVYDS